MDSTIASREIYWNIRGYLLLYPLLVCSISVLVYGIYLHYKKWRSGAPENRFDNFKDRLRTVLAEIILHKRLNRFQLIGVFHHFIIFCFFILFLGTTAVFLQADFGFEILHGWFYLIFQSLILDLAGIIIIFGIIYIIYHRFIKKPERYKNMSSGITMLFLLLIVVFSGFIVEGLRISATDDPFGKWSPIGYTIGLSFNMTPIVIQEKLHQFFWWFHMGSAFFLFAYLPFSKLRHIILGPLNIYFRRLGPKGITVDSIEIEKAEKLGAEKIEDLSWKNLLDLDACTECGRCQEFCPVFLSLQPFSPRDIIVELRNKLNLETKKKDNSENKDKNSTNIVKTLGDDTIWLCRTCRACMEECPVFIEHIPKFIEARRFEVMENAELPKTFQDAIEGIESRRHPYRGASVSRIDWCKSIEVPIIKDNEEIETLFWVGCTTALNEENWKIAQHISWILKEAGIDFGIMGNEEICCGEPARRIGNEFLFQTIRDENIEKINRIKFKNLITSCPHCYNIFKYEYGDAELADKTYHHSQYLLNLIESGRLKAENKLEQRITYHDPCYLGRYSNIYDEPRKIISKIYQKNIFEMKYKKSRSMCCGGGGGGAWLGDEKVKVENRLNVRRAQQALDTNAEILCTACPFCMTMLRDGCNTVSNDKRRIEVKDISELVYLACRR
jgi:Fe-S oxidoreductase/nitrate reductase gamma subunit